LASGSKGLRPIASRRENSFSLVDMVIIDEQRIERREERKERGVLPIQRKGIV
jgi:hypothetical protein